MHVVFLSGWGWPFVPVYIYTFLCASLYSLHNTYCFFPSFSIAASPFTISLSFLLACYTGTHVHVILHVEQEIEQSTCMCTFTCTYMYIHACVSIYKHMQVWFSCMYTCTCTCTLA